MLRGCLIVIYIKIEETLHATTGRKPKITWEHGTPVQYKKKNMKQMLHTVSGLDSIT